MGSDYKFKGIHELGLAIGGILIKITLICVN